MKAIQFRELTPPPVARLEREIEPCRKLPPAPPPRRFQNLLAVLALSVLFVSGVATFVDPDLWHGMALLRESLHLGRIPLEDRFAYTPTRDPIVHHEWGAAALLYFGATQAGAAGILILKYLLTAAIAVGSFLLARRRGASMGVLCHLTPVAIFMGWIGMTTIRAQVFTLVFLVLLLHFLEADRHGKKGWVLPWLLTYLLWVNVHGGFLAGVAIFSIHSIEQLIRRQPVKHLLATGVLMVALVAINPYGLAYYSYLWEAIGLERPLIPEWAPLWKAWPPTFGVFIFSLLLASYAAGKRGFWNLPGCALVGLAAYGALRHERHLSIYAVVWLSYVPSFLEGTNLGQILNRFWAGRREPLLLWSLVFALGAGAAINNQPWELRLPANVGDHQKLVYPVGAVDYLDGVDFHGNLMVPFTVGAFISWKLHPKVKVSIDGRYEAAYPQGALEECIDFFSGKPGWRETLKKYPTDAVLVPRWKPLSPILRGFDEWRLVYEDDAYEVYARPGLTLPPADRRGERLIGTFP
jgi:hypothetical protein